jgi:hypothetical protein
MAYLVTRGQRTTRQAGTRCRARGRRGRDEWSASDARAALECIARSTSMCIEALVERCSLEGDNVVTISTILGRS